jgi:hypothetical protein
VHETGPNVVLLEPRIASEDRVLVVAGGEHPEHVLDRETMAANDRLAAEDRWIL